MNYTSEASPAGLFILLLDRDHPALRPSLKITTTADKMEALLPDELLACISPAESGTAKSKGGRPRKAADEKALNDSSEKKLSDPAAEGVRAERSAASDRTWRTSSYLPFLYNAYKNAHARREEMAAVLKRNPVSILLEAERKAQKVLYKNGKPCFDAALLLQALTDPSMIPVKSPENRDRYIRSIRYYMQNNPEKAFSRAFLSLILSEMCGDCMDLLFPAVEYNFQREDSPLIYADELMRRGLYKEAAQICRGILSDGKSQDRAEAALMLGRIFRYHGETISGASADAGVSRSGALTSANTEARAYELFLKSGELGNGSESSSSTSDAFYELFLCERDGTGCRRDPEKAWKHLLAAAECGSLSAILAAGSVYYSGNDSFHIEADRKKAEELYRRGAETGDAVCETMYGKCLQDRGNIPEARYWFFRAARQGNTDASLLLTELDMCFFPENAVPASKTGDAAEEAGGETPEINDTAEETGDAAAKIGNPGAEQADAGNISSGSSFLNGTGICFTNSENEMSETFTASLPGSWTVLPLSEFEKTAISSRQSGTDSADRVFFFLADECTHQNLRDLDRVIHVLEKAPRGSGEGTFLTDKIHFYLRTEGNDSLAVKMADSFNSANELRRALAASDEALKASSTDAEPDLFDPRAHTDRISAAAGSNRVYRIRICNPLRDAAQYLLSRAPLFLPALADKRSQPHVLIIGDGEIVSELIADILSIFPYTKDGKPLDISVLSEQADRLREEIEDRMPEFFSRKSPLACSLRFFTLTSHEIRGVFRGTHPGTAKRAGSEANVPDDTKARDLRKVLDDANYYIVAGNNDAENVETAAYLRSALLAGGQAFGRLPFIAAYVRDDLLSRQAAHFSVIGEGIGFSWYNNYNLFCFGNSRQLYTAGELEDGYMEKRAFGVHRSCYGSAEDADAHAYADYWCRFYNRDSSHMAALAGIYRAYLAGVTLDRVDEYGQLDFEARLAGPLRKWLENPLHLEDAARAEHNRWVSFICSRGWRHASVSTMRSYIEAGNPRQQLYLAKLHPCITSWQRLPELEAQYNSIQRQRNPLWKDKKLIESDYDIVKAVPDLLAGP